MRAVPIPDGVAERMGGTRVTFGPAGGTPGQIRPCEYVETRSEVHPGGKAVHALIVPTDEERDAIAAGRPIWLTLDGARPAWYLQVDPGEPA